MSGALSGHGLRDEVVEQLRSAVDAADSGERRVAVFDYDNTCIHGDIGELFSQWLVDNGKYRTDLDTFWSLVDPADGRERARDLAQAWRDSVGSPSEVASFARYRAEMAALYPRYYARMGKRAAYAWAVLLHVGLTEDEMLRHSASCVNDEWRAALDGEVLQTDRGERFVLARGVRRYPAIAAIHEWLRSHGFEVWIVSASNWWTVSTAARLMYGHDPKFVVGNRVETDAATLTDRLVEPALFREGKVTAIEREIGVRPAIVFGDSETDLAMMQWATQLAVLIDHGDELMLEAASVDQFAIQPQAELAIEGP